MEHFFTYVAVLGALCTIVAVVLAFRGYLRGLFPPGFIIGVLPSDHEREQKNISKSSVVSFESVHEEIFHNEYLAQKNAGDNEMPSLLTNENRCRYIPAAKGDVIELPVIIQNIGKKQADWYTLIITFNTPSVGIVDVKTEYLEIDTVFVHDERNFIDPYLFRRLNAPAEIRQAFADLDLSHDFICFSGILEAKTYEMVYLKLKILEDIDHFFVCFRIDCPAWIAKTQVWLQPVRLKGE